MSRPENYGERPVTFIRRKALETASWVVWLAAPGCREWAEGLERELQFIESDWRALAWAVGSMRVLLDRREAPLRTLAEFSAAAKQLHKKRTNQTRFLYLVGVVSVVFWARMLFFLHSATWHGTGYSMGVSMAMAIHAYARRPRAIPESEDHGEMAAYYRAEIKRDSDFKKGSFYPAGMLAVLICADDSHGGVVTGVIVWATFLALFYLVGRHYERRMARLDALMEQMQ
jgi:hypothetical protein